MRRVLISLLALLLPLPAAAGWEATHWGMTPEEAAAALGGGEASAEGGLVLPWEGWGYTWRAVLAFGDGGLEGIRLEPAGIVAATCPSVRGLAREQWADPLDDPRDDNAVWADETGGNAVFVAEDGAGCALAFRPLGTAQVRTLPGDDDPGGRDR